MVDGSASVFLGFAQKGKKTPNFFACGGQKKTPARKKIDLGKKKLKNSKFSPNWGKKKLKSVKTLDLE